MSKKHGKTNEPAYVYFRIEGQTLPELREFNFATHEGRQAFLRFMSWAVGNKITVVLSDSVDATNVLTFLNKENPAPFNHNPSRMLGGEVKIN